MSEKINILTRTSNRPNYFRDCCASVDSQTYDNIKHIIATDDLNSESYIKKYRDEFLYIDPLKYKHSTPKKLWHSRRPEMPAWWNCYFNEMYNLVEDGWIMFLDDDDKFLHPNAIDEIIKYLKSEDSLLFWNVQFPGFTVPRSGTPSLELQPPTPGNISMIGFMFHSKYIKDSQFEPWGCGDFRLSYKLWHQLNPKIHINQTLTSLQHRPHLGNRQDKGQ